MIKMQVREKYVRNIISMKAQPLERTIKGIIAKQKIMGEEFLTLFIPYSGIDKRESFAIFHQQAAHGHVYEVVAISWICFLPDTLGYHAKHGTTVEFEMTGFDGMKFHGAKILRTEDWGPRTEDFKVG